MRYEISGGTFPVVTCGLANGEQMITEGGSMVWMTPNMQMETRAGGIGGMFSKAFSGENLFQNIYTARGEGSITFGSSFPGQILAMNNPTRSGSDSAEKRVPRLGSGRPTVDPFQQKIQHGPVRWRRIHHAAAERLRHRFRGNRR